MAIQTYIGRTKPNQEAIAELNVKKLGYRVDLFGLLVEKTTGALKRVSLEKEYLFPGYMFVDFDVNDLSWREINHERGMVKILGADPERPWPVPPHVMTDLRINFAAGAYTYRSTAPLVVVDSAYQVKKGSFSGLVGKCLKSKKKRIKLLLNMIGGACEVELDTADVVLVEPCKEPPAARQQVNHNLTSNRSAVLCRA